MKKLVMVRWAYTPYGVFSDVFFGESDTVKVEDMKKILVTIEPPSPKCIPTGPYMMRWLGHPIHGRCYEVVNVPGRTGILWHKGNTIADTEGCIIPGSDLSMTIPWGVDFSADALEKLYRLSNYEDLYLDIIYQPLYMRQETGKL